MQIIVSNDFSRPFHMINHETVEELSEKLLSVLEVNEMMFDSNFIRS